MSNQEIPTVEGFMERARLFDYGHNHYYSLWLDEQDKEELKYQEDLDEFKRIQEKRLEVCKKKCSKCGAYFPWEYGDCTETQIGNKQTCRMIIDNTCEHCWKLRCRYLSLIHIEIEKQFIQDSRIYEYLVTFTKKPDISAEKQDEYFKMAMDRHETLQIKEAKYVIEHEDSNRHIHAYIKTNKPLAKNRFATYIKKIGHVDLAKLKGTKADTLNYMSKEGEVIDLKIRNSNN